MTAGLAPHCCSRPRALQLESKGLAAEVDAALQGNLTSGRNVHQPLGRRAHVTQLNAAGRHVCSSHPVRHAHGWAFGGFCEHGMMQRDFRCGFVGCFRLFAS